MLFTSVPVNALDISGSDLSESTVNEEISENIESSEDSVATQDKPVATDSDASSLEDTSISDISSNDIDSSKEETTNNEISLQSGTEEDDEEASTDNWELGLVFYDSSVDNGKTPLTEINWDASDGSYKKGTPRVITVQINYKNTNAVTTYQPGDLKIKIPNLVYDTSGHDSAYIESSITVGANDTTHTGYDWSFVTGSTPTNAQEIYTFSNNVIIEEKANLEGSIQIVYVITPKYERENNSNSSIYPDTYIEKFHDMCEHRLEKILQADLNNVCQSEEIKFQYERTYSHPWKEKLYSLTKRASKIQSYDNLGNNAQDYIWVKYAMSYQYNDSSVYPNIEAIKTYIRDINIPDECVVYNSSGKLLEKTDGYYRLQGSGSGYWAGPNILGRTSTANIYVGYPKKIYNNENNNMLITNKAEVWGIYETKTEEEKLAEASVNINLADYSFDYSGDLYGISKNSSTNDIRYQDIVSNSGNYNVSSWSVVPYARYAGKPMTVKITDDLMFCSNQNQSYERLNDNEFYIKRIGQNKDAWRNGHGEIISGNKYDIELWVRRAGNETYEKISSFKVGNYVSGDKYGSGNGTMNYWNFSAGDKVVGFYFLIKDLNESIINSGGFSTDIVIKKSDIPTTGKLFNFANLQVFLRDDDGNLFLHNTVGRDSYETYITKEIADFDLEEYGAYVQRSFAEKTWEYYNPTISLDYGINKSSSDVTQDLANEKFIGSFSVGANLRGDTYYDLYKDEYKDDDTLKSLYMYDLLPGGMDISSSAEKIMNSLNIEYSWNSPDKLFRNLDGSILTKDKFYQIIKDNTKINITPNWKNTNRTKLEIVIDLSNNPIFIGSYYGPEINFTYDYEVSYDNFLDYGNIYKNYVYSEAFRKDGRSLSTQIYDNGYFDKEVIDINENNKTNDRFQYAQSSITITSVISTYQDVTKYVQTDKSNYSTGTVKASPSSEYTYKLRVRTGQNDVTNLVIYDSIEEYVQNKDGNIVPVYGNKKHWNGEFLGVDTSYAENKGYKVKVWYSEDKQAGNISEDNSWKEYSDLVDKSKVKSLAFEYLNKDDEAQKAVLPANSQTYVLVKMKTPPEENRKILAYNGCRTQWQALDDYDRPVDFITGINSNIVKVSLSDYYDLTVNKIWDDENNKWELRPDYIDIILKKSGVEIDRKSITRDNLSVIFTDLLTNDAKFYTIEEEPSLIYNSSVKYNELEDCYEVTNTLKDDVFTDISGTKTWVNDKEFNRPESITIKLIKDGEVYRTTTTNAEKEWKYSFDKVPIYNADETKCIYSVEEVPVERYSVQYTTPSNGLAIKFNNQCRTESVNYDYVEIYYKKDNQTFKLGKWGGTSLAGKTVNVPTKDFYLYWRTDGSNCSYYGFGIDSIEAAEVTETGTATTLSVETAIELTGANYPESPNHGNYGNNVNMLWHYTGVSAEGYDIINTYEGIDSVNLSFVKSIEGTDEAFEQMQLEKDALYTFQVSMKNRETNDIIYVPIDNKNVTTVSEVPIGTYVITEKDDMYFDFVSMEALNSVEGITFEKVGNDYILTITEGASEEETLQIKVNNKIEPDRPYEDKEEKENLFRIHKKDRPENPDTSETTNTSETSTTTTGTSSTTTGTGTTTTGSSTTSGSTSTGTGGFCTSTYITGIGWTTTCYGRNSNNNEEIFSPEVPHN